MPVNAEPTQAGNLRLFWRNHKLRSTVVQPGDEPVVGGRWLSHFATCPNATTHRGQRNGGSDAV